MPVRARLNSLAWDWARAASGVERRLVASMVAGVFAGVTVCAAGSVCLSDEGQTVADGRRTDGFRDLAFLPRAGRAADDKDRSTSCRLLLPLSEAALVLP